jgi:hypothetical protein
MRVVTLGALGTQAGLGDFYTVHERGFNPLRQRAGYDPHFLPRYNPNMRSRGLGAWYETPTFRYGLAAAAVMAGIYVVARSYR